MTKSFVSESLASKLKKAGTGDLIITTTSENKEDVCKAVAWLGEEEIVFGGHSVCFHHSLNPKYVSYFFQTEMFHQQKKKFLKGAKVIDIKADDIAKIKIPVPALEEQERIVGILDKFDRLVNDLSDGLPAEIEARRAQYAHYREKLLSF